GPARVRIADRGGEELKGAAGGALVRREQGRQRHARDGDGVRPDDLDNGRKLATAGVPALGHLGMLTSLISRSKVNKKRPKAALNLSFSVCLRSDIQSPLLCTRLRRSSIRCSISLHMALLSAGRLQAVPFNRDGSSKSGWFLFLWTYVKRSGRRSARGYYGSQRRAPG